MEQHPVPQQIASYEFRLVGDMTLKQFGYLASGCLVGLIFYGSSLPGFLKWSLVFGSGFLGFAFAFLPIEERPLSQWLMAFIRAIFSPTQFIWQKKPAELEIFKSPPGLGPKIILSSTLIPPTDRQQLDEYLKTLPSQSAELAQVIQPFPTILPERPIRIRKPRVYEAKTSRELPIPTPPNRPNILVGMVLDSANQMIEGAILEIRRSDGMPVRALKTNKLGQFQIVTPLDNDIYEIEVEKEGFEFDIIKIETKGEIIQPLEIRAK